MATDYGYLFSTTGVAERFMRDINFAADKRAFESIPNTIIEKSVDNDGYPTKLTPEVCFSRAASDAARVAIANSSDFQDVAKLNAESQVQREKRAMQIRKMQWQT